MSWAGQPVGQQMYGAPPGAYGQPPQAAYGQSPGYGAPMRPGAPPPGQAPSPTAPGYGAPPPQRGYAPPASQAAYGGAPPAGQMYGGAPPAQTHAYGQAPPLASTYGSAPPPTTAYGGAPPPQGVPYAGAPAPGYGAPPGGQPGYGGAPPPQQQMFGGVPQGYRPPGGGYQAAPAAQFRPPAPPPAGVSPDLWNWFQAVDADRSGQINVEELQQALHNGNWSPFNRETCRLMIGMFDRNKSGTIDIHEFSALWKYIQEWKACFDRFDTDRSGNINANELQNAFQTFGYNLTPQFCQTCIRLFNKRNAAGVMNFDDFIQCCVMLKGMTDQFRAKDTQQQGVINISYEDFLRMVLDNSVLT